MAATLSRLPASRTGEQFDEILKRVLQRHGEAFDPNVAHIFGVYAEIATERI
jgi:hypothetical protein